MLQNRLSTPHSVQKNYPLKGCETPRGMTHQVVELQRDPDLVEFSRYPGTYLHKHYKPTHDLILK